MINTYSYKITREEAKEKKLKDEEIFDQKLNKKLFNDFLECWNIIKAYAKNEKEDIKEKAFSEEDFLVSFLNDASYKSENHNYINDGYKYFIDLQNNILNNLLSNQNGLFYAKYIGYYNDYDYYCVPIDAANIFDILSFDDNIYKFSEYNNFGDVIKSFIKKKINDEIENLNEEEIEFDFQASEEEMTNLILAGKHHLKMGKNIIYKGEVFNEDNFYFLARFEEVYKTEELSQKEKIDIYSYLLKNYNKYEQNDYKKLYGHTKTLIFYLLHDNKYSDDVNKKITEILDELPENVYIDDDNFKGIFNINGNELKIKQIYSLFLFVEHLSFDVFIKQNLQDKYKEDLNKDIKNKLVEKINKIKFIKELASAVRRIITRDLYKNKNVYWTLLINQLKMTNYWDKQFRNKETIRKILEPLEDLDLSYKQSFHFYQIIKEEDEKEIIINPVFLEKYENINIHLRKSLCVINLQKRKKSIGFLCKIPSPDKNNLLPILVVNKNLINENKTEENKIIINLKDENKEICIYLKNKIIYKNEFFDIAFIEITDENFKEDNYFELDEIIVNKSIKEVNIYNNIYTLKYKKEKIYISLGELREILEEKDNIYSFSKIKLESNIFPIINHKNNKLIGIHINNNPIYN